MYAWIMTSLKKKLFYRRHSFDSCMYEDFEDQHADFVMTHLKSHKEKPVLECFVSDGVQCYAPMVKSIEGR